MNEEVFFVTLKGRAVTLASITKNQLTPYVDVFNMNDGNNPAKVNVLSVGTNVTLEDSSTLNVYVETIATYSIDTEKIIKTNVNNELSYSIQAESFNIRLVGLSSNIAKVDTSELAFYINMEDYQEGMHMIDVVVSNESLPEGVRLYDEITIAVMITKQ
jgi:YbbR domain-containing protein